MSYQLYWCSWCAERPQLVSWNHKTGFGTLGWPRWLPLGTLSRRYIWLACQRTNAKCCANENFHFSTQRPCVSVDPSTPRQHPVLTPSQHPVLTTPPPHARLARHFSLGEIEQHGADCIVSISSCYVSLSGDYDTSAARVLAESNLSLECRLADVCAVPGLCTEQ